MPHTPGPWRVAQYAQRPRAIEVISAEHPYIVAIVHEANAMEADARLIAAAPDLLAALQGLLVCAEYNGCDVTEDGAIAVDAARTAIAKATQA